MALFLDTETCGLTGIIVLIQWAEDDGPVNLHEVWNRPTRDTLRLIERFCNDDVCGFNLTFDWFHLTKLFNLLSSCEDKSRPPVVKELIQGRHVCLKPKSALDLFLFARKGPWQSLMLREEFRIRKVPIELAEALRAICEERIKFAPLYNARWIAELNIHDPRFMDIILRMRPRSGLKVLATEIYKTQFSDYPMPREKYPPDEPFNPYHTKWVPYLEYHIQFWKLNKQARSYAEQDVILLQRLYHTWGEPEFGDDDSELACAVGAARWRGFDINLDEINKRLYEQEGIVAKSQVIVNAHSHIATKRYLKSKAIGLEEALIVDTSKKTLLSLMELNSALGEAATMIFNCRKAAKEIDILNKLRITGKLCPDFKIIGARSGRMSGAGGLNTQGIQHDIGFRELFTLSNSAELLSGGDFNSFEVTIADAVYRDDNLRKDLNSGKSFHGLFGQFIYDLPYETIISSKGEERDYYSKSKQATLGLMYGAQPKKIAETTGTTQESSERAFDKFLQQYPKIGKARADIFAAFCSMQQPKGVGTNIEWHEPAEFISTLFGFRRYFTLENRICRVLFELASHPPRAMKNYSGHVRRSKDRDQTICGAMQSALYSCAFQIQAGNMRSAANHVIQGTGAQITKALQRRLWDLQPIGIADWQIQTINVHDEVLVVHQVKDLVDTVNQFVEERKSIVPLLSMDWKTGLKSWGDLKE